MTLRKEKYQNCIIFLNDTLLKTEFLVSDRQTDRARLDALSSQTNLKCAKSFCLLEFLKNNLNIL